ncbi:MAG: hypothetical protein ABIO91_01460 [Pyrinomonadaceae bacterium]
MADNDSETLKFLGYSLGDLQDKYRDMPPHERADLRPKLDEAFDAYQDLRILLLSPGVIITDADLGQMKAIGDEISRAADKQSLISGAIKLVGFARGFIV